MGYMIWDIGYGRSGAEVLSMGRKGLIGFCRDQ
jgi:hypothetical protein